MTDPRRGARERARHEIVPRLILAAAMQAAEKEPETPVRPHHHAGVAAGIVEQLGTLPKADAPAFMAEATQQAKLFIAHARDDAPQAVLLTAALALLRSQAEAEQQPESLRLAVQYVLSVLKDPPEVAAISEAALRAEKIAAACHYSHGIRTILDFPVT